MDEVWIDIRGYEGIYQISSHGRVKSLIKGEKIRKIQINKNRNDYCEISLFNNGIEKRFKVHRLVAENFISNEDNKPEVNHKDGNKSNNCVDNLEWVTSKENKKHAWDNSLYSSNHKKRKIICLETGKIFDSVIECSKILNIDRRTIFRVLKGQRKSCNGYKFKYAS
jgi:hypothetical protein